MPREAFQNALRRAPDWPELARRIEAHESVRLAGLCGSARALVAGTLLDDAGRGALVIVPHARALETWESDLALSFGAERVAVFPSLEILPFEEKSSPPEAVAARMAALARLRRGEVIAVVATARGLLQRILPPEVLDAAIIDLRVGDERDPRELARRLVAIGFERLPIVEEPGTISVRGGILDVFSFGRHGPFRVEFGDDGVESIREFDPRSQRSTRRVESISISPQTEVPLTPAVRARAESSALEGALGESVRRAAPFDGMECLLPEYFPRLATILDYLPDRYAVVTPEPRELLPPQEHLWEEVRRFRAARAGEDPEVDAALPQPEVLFATLDGLAPEMRSRPVVSLSARAGADAGAEEAPDPAAPFTASFRAEPQPSHAGSLELLSADLARLGAANELFIVCDNDGQAQRLGELLEGDHGALIVVDAVSEGFVLPEARLVVFTDHEIFNRYRRRRAYPRYKGAGPIEDYHALSEGDMVVHVAHGIGRFVRLEPIEVDGLRRDCVLVSYKGGDKLYVPTDQLDLLEKFVGKDGDAPKLDRLGGKEWSRVKERTKKAIKEMAQELIQLYAARQSKPGFAFSADTHWQGELESSFIYEETPDQLKAILDVKADLEGSRPMDRLVCGDVGYGKTEVAVRAAFKAVMDGKQVAILVPTTLLAEQHLSTFRERLAGFPVEVEMLSRFRSASEQAAIVRSLANGQVDIVIGTHRLLQKDIVFKDLGLVVIDEEQRFGVAHKERLKRFRRLVDVLTLTATPIPRTLHMSLLGVRDMSVIDTPPPGRLPIETDIVEWNDEVIAGAILREVDRGGQVFFVHNRVQTIETVARHLRRIVPEVRFAVAHGQMRERALEGVMLEFLDKKYDVLVSTMIIESGLDIPSVNTIIVDRADAMGLAQLYQLRGRVGRANVRAYAYLVTPPLQSLTDDAMKRLNALRDFTELGAGFKIAMKDLEIRGTGNLLGPEQHGYLAAVGFDLYCRLLEEAVRELRGEPEGEKISARIEADLDAFIPDDLVQESEVRLGFYKRLARTGSEAEVEALLAELQDRYGSLPAPTANLFLLRGLRLAAEQAGVESVRIREGRARLQVSPAREVGRDQVGRMVAASPVPLEFLSGDGRSLRADFSALPAEERLAAVRKLLIALYPADIISV